MPNVLPEISLRRTWLWLEQSLMRAAFWWTISFQRLGAGFYSKIIGNLPSWKIFKIDSFHGSMAFIVRSTLALVSIQAMFLGRTSPAFCRIVGNNDIFVGWTWGHLLCPDPCGQQGPQKTSRMRSEIWWTSIFRRRKRTSTGSVEDNGGMWRRRPGTRNPRRDSKLPGEFLIHEDSPRKSYEVHFGFYFIFFWSVKPSGFFYVLKVDMLSKISLSAEVSEFSANFFRKSLRCFSAPWDPRQ